MEFIENMEALVSSISSNIICISGCSRVGKSTLSRNLQQYLKSNGKTAQVLSLDHWIIDYRQRDQSMNVLERFQVEKLISDLNKIKEEEILLPGYDFESREVKTELERPFRYVSDYLIIEGVISLAIVDRIKYNTTNIYIDIEDKIRKKRLFDFYSKHKGFDERSIRQIIEEREKEEVPFIKNTKQKADIIYLPKI